MNFDNDEEAIGFINRLLEQLQQADIKALGSINVNIYKEGSQHVDRVENQYFYGSLTPSLTPGPSPTGEGSVKDEGSLPAPLASDKAMALWEKVLAAGYVDDDYQPLISRTQSALLADAMAMRLGIREKWKVFETLWNRTKMYKDYYEAVEQKQYLPFLDKLKEILD